MNLIFINYQRIIVIHLYHPSLPFQMPSMQRKEDNYTSNFIIGAIIGEISIDLSAISDERKVYLSINFSEEMELNIQSLLNNNLKIYTEGDLKGIQLSFGELKIENISYLLIEMRDIFPKNKSIPGDLSCSSKNQGLRMNFLDYYEHTSTIHLERKK